MKFFVAFAALVAITIASPLKPLHSDLAELEAIVAAINSPSTDPATAALLEQQLQDIIAAANPEPIAVGPVIIPAEPVDVGPVIIPEPINEGEPISVGPAIVDFPMPDGGAVSAPVIPVAPVVVPSPSPVVVGPIAPGAPAPLVQVILNINQAASPVAPAPVVTPAPGDGPAPVRPDPVQVVDSPVEPVQVVDVSPEPVEVQPVEVVEAAPIPVEPVVIGTPILPSPAVVLPEELN